ncbi:hypothetical protein CLIB1423_26S00386 [[Candida] railenensis]|uniref:Uncharacterized protein n=1 Tax=[Candida] railenensis TaxID=45579 RepID=A0A9P0QW49_9ASCO|nr:hypothetical protein CLIB1423_26S00386 [[Candida] railenensis]
MESLESDKSSSASPHIGGVVQPPSLFQIQAQTSQQNVVRPQVSNAALNSLRKRSVSMNSNSSLTPAHRMSIISLGSPRNSIVSVDDALRTTHTRNNSCTSLTSVSSPVASNLGNSGGTNLGGNLSHNLVAAKKSPHSNPITSLFHSGSSTDITVLLSDDDVSDHLSQPILHKRFKLKDDFQFKYDALEPSTPPQPAGKISSPLTESPLDAGSRIMHGTNLAPEERVPPRDLNPSPSSNADSSENNNLHKKSKVQQLLQLPKAPNMLLKKRNLFSKDLQYEISNRKSETVFVRSTAENNKSTLGGSKTTNPKNDETSATGAGAGASTSASASIKSVASRIIPNNENTMEQQNSLITKLNRKWNKSNSILDKFPGKKIELQRERKRSRAILESDSDDNYDL